MQYRGFKGKIDVDNGNVYIFKQRFKNIHEVVNYYNNLEKAKNMFRKRTLSRQTTIENPLFMKIKPLF